MTMVTLSGIVRSVAMRWNHARERETWSVRSVRDLLAPEANTLHRGIGPDQIIPSGQRCRAAESTTKDVISDSRTAGSHCANRRCNLRTSLLFVVSRHHRQPPP
jgi:hypothetical protein